MALKDKKKRNKKKKEKKKKTKKKKKKKKKKKECSRQKGQHVQGPDMFEEEQGNQCDCSRVSRADEAGGCSRKGG